ncbi:proliferation marker protein Ki-67 isoform X2 [Neoarius graeffei]|uniref:proliferation marker protein Ki-67 isoform X2 n=1 Tax=Neoarius graeffei TaxID=443677 RepID=UPI00298C17F5|nr:proliferation marker protein Ki-67 isoform X2 [Neoarius graeffei]
MPLFGKIVVIKRNGADGNEFPLTASCLFGRKLDCDIRIQLPQVSKEHCRIELNENKELILTNLSSVNPTRINGEILQQSERLKHGDLITIIDRSFRFEYPPALTPKKKHLSTPGKGETVKVLQDQQVKSTPGTTEKKKSEHATDTCLKDGSNLPACLDQSVGDQQNKATMDSTFSPFSDLYNMVKQDLATKPVWKSASLSNTPLSRPSVGKQETKKVSSENHKPVTPKLAHKKRRSSTAKPIEDAQAENLSAQVKTATPVVQGEQKRRSEGVDMAVSQKKTPQTTPQKFTADQVVQQITFESPSTKSLKARRRSASQTPETQTPSQNPSELAEAEETRAKQTTRTSPRASAGKRLQIQEVLQEIITTPTSDDKGNGQAFSKKHKCDDLPIPAPKRKRVSFGGQLSPELFDKRLPPNSPLRRGATPGRRSLGFPQKPHSLLRRASTIGLMGYQLEEDMTESPAKNASSKRVVSPAKTQSPSSAKTPKTPSPAKTPKSPSPAKTPKTPSHAKKSPSPKAKTPSPKNSKTPPPSSNPSTSKSSRKFSNTSANSPSPSEGSLLKTPTMHGRFSVSQISTPSPVVNQEKGAKEKSVSVLEEPREHVTPRSMPRRSSMKVSARKTPKSMLRSALDVVRSRRSGASCANLKVVSSWADIVKYGQAKPQTEGGAKKAATRKMVIKRTKITKPKTPARRLKDSTSTGHAASPASIVVGKAYLRSTQLLGAAPKVVCNSALLERDMKMDEDLTGVSDIFKTPANSRRKSAFTKSNECPATPLGVGEMTEMSIMNTPEESGEMVVSPMGVVSTAKQGCYNSEALTRLLQDNQERSFIEEIDASSALSPSEVSTLLDMLSEDQIESKKAVPGQTPQHKPAPSERPTGVKRLLRTPKQKAEPVEDLRGKLLKTPKEPKPPQEECLEGVKELLNTPKQNGTPLEEDMAGLKRLMKTPKVRNSPVVCAVGLKRLVKTPKDKTEQEENLTGVKQLMKTPKQKKQLAEEDLTGVQEMMKTPKQEKQPVKEDLTGVREMIKTPKQKKQPVKEDLTGVREMMKTPKQKKQPVKEDLTGVREMMKTPKQKKQPVEEDLTGVREMMKTPKQKKQPVEEDLTGVREMMKTPKQKKRPVEEDLTGVREMMKTPKQKKRPVKEDLTGVREMMKTPKPKKRPVEEDLTGVQEMMKTPKQKSQPIENLVGVKSLRQIPKEKGEPVENDFVIDNLMKTPKQKRGEAVVGFTIAAELDSVGSGVLPVEEANEESEEKENICLVEDVKKDTEAAVGLHIETVEAKTSCQEVEGVRTCEVMTKVNEDAAQKAPLEAVCTSEMISMAVKATTSVASPKQSNRSSPAEKARHGAQVRTVQKSQKSQECQMGLDSLSATVTGTEDEPSTDSAKSVPSVRGRRGKSAIELIEDVPAQSPARKSTRGRIPKEQVEAQKFCTSAEDEQVALKPRRGRKAQQNIEVLQVGPVTDLKASAEVEASMKSPAPARAKKGRKEKHESENPQEPQASVDEVGVVSEIAEHQPSAETEAQVKSNTRARRGRTTRKEPRIAPEVEETSDIKSSDAVVTVKAAVLESSESAAENEDFLKSTAKTRRGRPTKKEMLKTSQVEFPAPIQTVVESDVKSSDVVKLDVAVEPKLPKSAEVQSVRETEEPIKANSKPRRGRAAKKETPVTAHFKETFKSTLDSVVLSEELTQIPVVKSKQGRKVNPVALNNQVVVESNVEPHVAESEPQPEAPAVRSSRGARNKQLKSQVEDTANGPATETIATAAVTEEPVVKNVRGNRRTKQPKDQVLDDSQEEAKGKPSIDSGTIQQSGAPGARSARGKRTAAIKNETEAPVKRGRRVATVEVPPAANKPSRGRKAAAKSEPEKVAEDITAVVEPVEETSTETKVPESVTNETPLKQTDSEGVVVAKRGRGRIAKKTKVSAKDTSVNEAEKEAAKEAPQLKNSKKKDESAATDDPLIAETKQLVCPSVKGCKGRGAKKQEEPEKETPAAEENVQPVRRGRAGASVVSQHKVAACPKGGQKRKAVGVVAEETQESLPKRKRDKGAGAAALTDAAVPGKGRRTAMKKAEETSEVEAEEPPKKEAKPVRGRRKATQEGVPPRAEDPVLETTTCRGTRGQKKAEMDVLTAPVRRTRRK